MDIGRYLCRQLCGLAFSVILIFGECWADELHAGNMSDNLLAMNLEELMEVQIPKIYTASKHTESAAEAPASVTVITADEIRKYGYRSFSEILDSVRGVFTSYDRDYAYTGIRGFIKSGDYDTRLLLLLNGKRINDSVYGSFLSSDGFVVDVDLIERVEVIRGASSSLYGTSALLGIINVITKNGKSVDAVETAVSVGTFDSYTSRITYGGITEFGFDYLLSGSYFKSHGNPHLYFEEFDDPESNNGWADNVDDLEGGSFFLNAEYNNFTLQAAHVQREKGIPTASYETVFNNPSTRDWEEFSQLSLSYQNRFENDFALDFKTAYNHSKYKGDYLSDYAEEGDPPDIVLNKDSSRGNSLGTVVQLSKFINDEHVITGGLEYNYHFNQDIENYDEAPYFLYSSEKHTSFDLGAYLQSKLVLHENLQLNAGFRFDHYKTFGETYNPRVAFIYRPIRKTFLKLIYGQAFRAPNSYELFYADAENVSKGNPNLEPETIQSYELVWEQLLSKQIRSTVSVYHYKIQDLISQIEDPLDGALVFQNLEQISTIGAEAEVQGKWDNGFQFRLSYAFQEARNDTSDQHFVGIPHHLAKANIIAPLFLDNLSLGTELRYVGDRTTLTGGDVEAYYLANLTLLGRLLEERLEISLSVYDVFDEQYHHLAGLEHLQDSIEQNGRTFRAKLLYRF